MARTLMRFTGVGGQGVLLAGEIFAAAKIKEGGHGLKTATYTSQVRGGPTVVDITLDDEEIFYPYANDGEIDFMLSVAQASYNLFKNGVTPGGTIVIEPQFSWASDFSEGLAPVAVPGEPGLKKWGYIDQSGAWAIEPRFGGAQAFSSGLASVRLDGAMAYIDTTGTVIWQQ